MNQAMQYLSQKSNDELAIHPLYQWIRDEHAEQPERKLEAALPILSFILTFPYYNQVYLTTDEHTPIGHAINEHAQEDARHLFLFIQDMKKFSLDDVWGITQVSDLLWVTWSSPFLKPARKILHDRVHSLLSAKNDLHLRYFHIEQIEIDGHFLFSAFAKASEMIAEKHQGQNLMYFGKHHLERENGHVSLVDDQEINFDSSSTTQVMSLIEQKHQLSMDMNDIMHDFVKTTASYEKPGLLFINERMSLMRKIDHALAAYEAGHTPEISWSICPTETVCDKELYTHWSEQHDRFLNHPLFDRIVNTKDEDLEYTLRMVMVYFANRLLSMNAFHLFDLELSHGGEPCAYETALKSIRTMFATHYGVFFHDWMQLDIDQKIGLNVPEFIQQMFADKNNAPADMIALHEFRRQAILVATTPALKLWCYLSMYCMAQAYTRATRVLADRYYQRYGKRLAYMSGILHLSYSDVDSDWNNDEKIKTLYSMPISIDKKQ